MLVDICHAHFGTFCVSQISFAASVLPPDLVDANGGLLYEAWVHRHVSLRLLDALSMLRARYEFISCGLSSRVMKLCVADWQNRRRLLHSAPGVSDYGISSLLVTLTTFLSSRPSWAAIVFQGGPFRDGNASLRRWR